MPTGGLCWSPIIIIGKTAVVKDLNEPKIYKLYEKTRSMAVRKANQRVISMLKY